MPYNANLTRLNEPCYRVDMMAKATRKVGRPVEGNKLTIWCRIDADAIKALDDMAKVMEPKPSRAQLIDLAVRRFVENKGK